MKRRWPEGKGGGEVIRGTQFVYISFKRGQLFEGDD